MLIIIMGRELENAETCGGRIFNGVGRRKPSRGSRD
jgi:hypothetical protein